MQQGNPGSWGNGLRLGMIDAKADQILVGVATTGVADVGYGITQAVPAGTVIANAGAGAGTTSVLDGYFKGIITEVGQGEIAVKILTHVSACWNIH